MSGLSMSAKLRLGNQSLLTAGMLVFMAQAHADSMSALIAQKSAQANVRYTPSYSAAPAATVSTRSTIKRARPHTATRSTSYSYPQPFYQPPQVLPAFLSGSYDNVDSQYLPILSQAESQSSTAAREVISTARTMALNERAIIQGGCWDYLDAVFKRAGVTRDTVHKGIYRQGPYAASHEIQAGDWLYYINHGYNGADAQLCR